MDDEPVEPVVPDTTESALNFRAELFQRLQSKGFLDALKSQLRRHLINELTGSGRKHKAGDGINTATGATTADAAKKPLSLKLTNSLIVQHLEACEYDYTMSVFLPECGMTVKEVLTTEEVGHYIRLDLYGLSADKLMSDSKQSVLWKMLSTIPDRKSTLDCGTQTDRVSMLAGVVGIIDQKMSAIDEHYNAKEDGSRKSSSVQIEERLLGYQRQMDKMSAEHIAREIERFRSTEQSQIRAEEQQRFQQELEKCRKEMEASYSQKLAALQERERLAFDKLQKDYELMGHETYRQRQQLLKQIEELRIRESDLRRQQENSSRESKLAEDRLKKMDEMLHNREASIAQKEKEYDVHLKLLSDRIRAEEKEKYETRNKELQEMHLKLKEEEHNLRLHRERLLSSEERQELVEKRQRVMQLDSLVTKYTHELSAADANMRQLQDRLRHTIDYDTLRDTNLTLRSELDHVKQRLAEVLKDNEKLRERHEQLMKEFSQKSNSGMSSSDVLTFRIEMERLKDMAVQDKIIAEARLADALAKLHSQMEKNRALVVEYEKQTDSLRGMNRLLAQSQHSVDLDAKEHADARAAAEAQGRARPTLSRGHRNISTADAAPLEKQLGAAWVPYPADAARCLASDHTRHRFGTTGLHGWSTCAGSDTAEWQKKSCCRPHHSTADIGRASGDSPCHASARNTATAAPTATAADASHSTSSDSTAACDSLVEDTRRRLHGLETEAERLQLALQSLGASTGLSPGKAHSRHVCDSTQYLTANAILLRAPSSGSPSNLGLQTSPELGQFSAFRRYQRTSADPPFDRSSTSGGNVNPTLSSALSRKPNIDNNVTGLSWDNAYPRLPTAVVGDDAVRQERLQTGGVRSAQEHIDGSRDPEPVRGEAPLSEYAHRNWRYEPHALNRDGLVEDALRQEGYRRDADFGGELTSVATANIRNADRSDRKGPNFAAAKPTADSGETDRDAAPSEEWGIMASSAGRGSIIDGSSRRLINEDSGASEHSRAAEPDYPGATRGSSNNQTGGVVLLAALAAATAVARVSDGTATAPLLLTNHQQQEHIAYSRLPSQPQLEVSLDNEWKKAGQQAVTTADSDDSNSGGSPSQQQQQQLASAAATPDRQSGHGGESDDNADNRPGKSATGFEPTIRHEAAASPPLAVVQSSTRDEMEGTGMSDAMQKYMQMMQRQPETRQQQRQSDEEEFQDGRDEATPSLSVDASENTTDEGQDRSDNFW